MTLHVRDFLARVTAFEFCRAGVFHVLRINDQKRSASVAPLSGTGRANLTF